MRVRFVSADNELGHPSPGLLTQPAATVCHSCPKEPGRRRSPAPEPAPRRQGDRDAAQGECADGAHGIRASRGRQHQSAAGGVRQGHDNPAGIAAGSATGPAWPMPMLTVQQTAALLAMSRMTVVRKADAGELPCVILSRGTRQKMRRLPRGAIEELAAVGGGGAQVDLTEYTSRWLAANAARPDAQGPRAAVRQPALRPNCGGQCARANDVVVHGARASCGG
jgi:excisionase family DNA binding protein